MRHAMDRISGAQALSFRKVAAKGFCQDLLCITKFGIMLKKPGWYSARRYEDAATARIKPS
jgi:hypothetical protein